MEAIERIEAIEIAVKKAGIAQKEVLTFDEAAAYTGFSKSYLYKQTAAKRIPHYKPAGKMLFFSRMELQAWLMSNRVATNDEIEIAAVNYCVNGGRRK